MRRTRLKAEVLQPALEILRSVVRLEIPGIIVGPVLALVIDGLLVTVESSAMLAG